MARWISLLAPILLAACALEERSDFLVGRECKRGFPESCDPGQQCLPHRYGSKGPTDYRCRDARSFEPVGGVEPPLAYCDGVEDVCPEGLVCNADRVRVLDGGLRRFVCQWPDNPFAPPLPPDAG